MAEYTCTATVSSRYAASAAAAYAESSRHWYGFITERHAPQQQHGSRPAAPAGSSAASATAAAPDAEVAQHAAPAGDGAQYPQESPAVNGRLHKTGQCWVIITRCLCDFQIPPFKSY